MQYTLDCGVTLEIKVHNNTAVFEKLSTMGLVRPKVPKYYISARDVWVDNPDNPIYRKALEVYEAEKPIKALDAVLLLAIPIVHEEVNKQKNKPKFKRSKATDEAVWLSILKDMLSDQDLYNIVNECFLTENVVYDIFNMLVMSIYRGGTQIINARLKNAINSQIELDHVNVMGIQLVHPLDSYTACIESNLDWMKWQTMPMQEKANVIALHRIKRIVENHASDEMQIESERRNK
jgi:hypothetical protein